MKKKISAALAALCLIALTGCGASGHGEAVSANAHETSARTETTADTAPVTEAAPVVTEATEAEPEKAAVPCADVINSILSGIELPSMAEIGRDRLGMYLNLEIPEGCDFAMSICGSGGFADEIFIINTNSADISADDVRAAAESRIEYRKKDFEGYNPDEFEKLDNYITAEKNGYFMYAVTSDNSSCESIFNSSVN